MKNFRRVSRCRIRETGFLFSLIRVAIFQSHAFPYAVSGTAPLLCSCIYNGFFIRDFISRAISVQAKRLAGSGKNDSLAESAVYETDEYRLIQISPYFSIEFRF